MMIIKNILIGVVIGGGMILPGVSGGVLAVVFGVYEGMLEAVGHFFKDIKRNLYFLSPIIIGMIIGVLLFGKVLFFVFEKYPVEAKYTFIGLILGGVPVLLKEVKKKDMKRLHLPSFILSFLIAVILFVLGKGIININFSTNIDGDLFSYILLFITGFIFIAGKIIPGISSSFLLMLIGMYAYILNILNNPLSFLTNDYMQMIALAMGIAVGAVILIRVIQKLLKNYFSITYSIIIGFVIGSITAIYPGFTFDLHSIIGCSLMAIAFLTSYKFIATDK